MWEDLRKINAMNWKIYHAYLQVFYNQTECIFNATIILL